MELGVDLLEKLVVDVHQNLGLLQLTVVPEGQHRLQEACIQPEGALRLRGNVDNARRHSTLTLQVLVRGVSLGVGLEHYFGLLLKCLQLPLCFFLLALIVLLFILLLVVFV